MTPREALDAFADLAKNSPSHVGSRVDRATGEIVRGCMRCGVQERKKLPELVNLAHARGRGADPQDVPAGYDEELLAWLRQFADAHRGCS